jgi:two-component system, chemotaxis family, protein-glutamate methylesterase/glutaminase
VTPPEPSSAFAAGDRPARVVAIGASAGGVEALVAIAKGLPADFPAAVCIVLHIPASGRSLLAPILDRNSALAVEVAADGMPLRPGHVYVAPADHHLLVTDAAVALSRGPKENGVRPAVDVLFRSVAASWGPDAIAVVLSGALDDGASGAASVASAGGTVVVQDPSDAVVPGMPESALAAADADHVVALGEMPALLARLTAGPPTQPAPKEVAVPSPPDPADLAVTRERPQSPPSGFTCPECSGALWEVQDGELVRYRCRVGHVYSEEALVDGQAYTVEAALWTALEVLEERVELLGRVAARLDTAKPRSARQFRNTAATAAQRAELLRRALGVDAAAGAPTAEAAARA